LELLDLQEKVVTIDAMGCQKEVARIVVEQQGDYVLAVKDNQPTLHAEVQAAFEATAGTPPKHRAVTTVEDDHGRHESRSVRVLPAAAHLSRWTRDAWLGLLTLVMVTRVVTCNATGAVSHGERTSNA